MKNIQKKGQHSPVVQLFLKHLVSSNALFFIFPPQTLARVQRSAILRSQSRPREALLARTNYGKKNFATRRRVYNVIVYYYLLCIQTVVSGALKCRVYLTYTDEYFTAL